jgi:hypothetical protein
MGGNRSWVDPPAEISSWEPNIRERIAGWLQDAQTALGRDKYQAGDTARTLTGGLDFTPALWMTDLKDALVGAKESADRGDKVGAATEGGLGVLSAALTAVPGGGAAKKVAGKAKDLIKDWKWRDPQAVKAALQGLSEVPQHIQEGFGPFMRQQAARATGGDLGVDDLVKAYAITRGSVQRQARGSQRPEDAVADWLMSNAGRDYRGAAAIGKTDQGAIYDARQMIKPFGLDESFARDLRYGAENLGPYVANLQQALTGGTRDWHDLAQALNQIGPTKSGFLASLLGRGDIPVLDARQLALHAPDSTKQEVSMFLRRGGGEGGNQAIDRLAGRQSDLALALNPDLEPFRQSLTHHAVWDQASGTVTPHDEIAQAMLDRQVRGSPPNFSGGYGSGRTSYSMSPELYGFPKPMPVSEFTKLAFPLTSEQYDPRSLEFLSRALTEGRPIAPPHLGVVWNKERGTWDVIDHEGRHRSRTIAEMFGPEHQEAPVNIVVKGMPLKEVTPEMREAPFRSQQVVFDEGEAAYNERRAAREEAMRQARMRRAQGIYSEDD